MVMYFISLQPVHFQRSCLHRKHGIRPIRKLFNSPTATYLRPFPCLGFFFLGPTDWDIMGDFGIRSVPQSVATIIEMKINCHDRSKKCADKHAEYTASCLAGNTTHNDPERKCKTAYHA